MLQKKSKKCTPQKTLVGGSSKGGICACSKGETLAGVIPQDFRPDVLGWMWGLGHGPELA